MKKIMTVPNTLRIIFSVVLTFGIFFAAMFFPAASYAIDSQVSPAVSSLVNSFSKQFCVSVSEGGNVEDAAEGAARKMIRGLVFSGDLKEVMSVPRDDMARFVATSIFDQCGDQTGITLQELNDYLIKLAENDPSQSQPKPFKPFGVG